MDFDHYRELQKCKVLLAWNKAKNFMILNILFLISCKSAKTWEDWKTTETTKMGEEREKRRVL